MINEVMKHRGQEFQLACREHIDTEKHVRFKSSAGQLILVDKFENLDGDFFYVPVMKCDLNIYRK